MIFRWWVGKTGRRTAISASNQRQPKWVPDVVQTRKTKMLNQQNITTKTEQKMLLLALCSNRNTDKGQITFWPRSCRHEPQLENHRTNKSQTHGHVVLFRWVYGGRSFGENFNASWKSNPGDRESGKVWSRWLSWWVRFIKILVEVD